MLIGLAHLPKILNVKSRVGALSGSNGMQNHVMRKCQKRRKMMPNQARRYSTERVGRLGDDGNGAAVRTSVGNPLSPMGRVAHEFND